MHGSSADCWPSGAPQQSDAGLICAAVSTWGNLSPEGTHGSAPVTVGACCRWYYWADTLGILVWQDMPCLYWEWGSSPNPSDAGEQGGPGFYVALGIALLLACLLHLGAGRWSCHFSGSSE